MAIMYDSKRLEHKDPFGCVRQDELCSMNIGIPRRYAVKEVFICVENHHGYYKEFPMVWSSLQHGLDRYSGGFALEYCDLYYYHFRVVTTRSEFKVYKQGFNGTNIGSGECWQLTCYDKHYDTPRAYKGKVMYQIFPDRFNKLGSCDLSDKLKPFHVHDQLTDVPVYQSNDEGEIENNDFFGGNLKGIQAKLPYLKDLSVSIIYLNPIFMAYSNHRYDTADYKRVDPMLGAERDFIELCDAAQELGMKVILDGAFSHTGSNSVYFDKENVFGNGAYHHPNSPYSSWFNFIEYPKRYESWWGIHTLPCVNEMDSSYLDFMLNRDDSVIRHWLRLGADGYRLDVVDELPDEFIVKLNHIVKDEKYESIVIGEVWEDASNKESYGIKRKYFTQSELDSVMNYPYKNAIIAFIQGESSAAELANTVMTIAENYPKPVLDCLMNSLSTHDTMRILTAVGTERFDLTKDEKATHKLSPKALKLAIQKEKAAAFLQYMLPGSPCIYYGDEAGMEGFEDPFNRRYFQWDSMNENLLYYYVELGRIKTSYEALALGTIEIVIAEDYLFGFRRMYDRSELTALLNVNDDIVEWFDIAGDVILSHNCVQSGERIMLGKYGYVLFENVPAQHDNR
ncbi:glycoside hydrolase family 13 protein [Paenibacillus marinisediminis]